MYLNLVYQLELLVHDKLRPCALDLHFLMLFEYFVIISNSDATSTVHPCDRYLAALWPCDLALS